MVGQGAVWPHLVRILLAPDSSFSRTSASAKKTSTLKHSSRGRPLKRAACWARTPSASTGAPVFKDNANPDPFARSQFDSLSHNSAPI